MNADDAKRIVDQVMNRDPYYTLFLGNVTVTDLEKVPEGNNIDKEYNIYKIWAQVGAIKTTSQGGPLIQQPYSSNNMLSMMWGVFMSEL